MAQSFGLSVRRENDVLDPFDVGYRYEQHQKLRVFNAQEIIDYLGYISDRNPDAVHSVAISYNGVLCPISEFISEDSQEVLANSSSQDLDDGCVIVDDTVDISTDNFPRLRIINASDNVSNPTLTSHFERVIKSDNRQLAASIKETLVQDKRLALVAIPHGHGQKTNWLLDHQDQVVFPDDARDMAAE